MNTKKKYDVTFGRHISELAKLRDNARESKAWSAAVNAEVATWQSSWTFMLNKRLLGPAVYPT
jgi:hypothetical protein